MLRFFTLSSFLAGLLFSLVVVLPFQPTARTKSAANFFQINVQTEVLGYAQLFYDLGRGINEADSKQVLLEANRPTTLRIPLPLGTYRAFRFDPLDRGTQMELSAARVVDAAGRTVVDLPVAKFKPAQQITSSRLEGEVLKIQTTPGGTDPILTCPVEQPFTLTAKYDVGAYLRSTVYVFISWIILCGAAGLVGLKAHEPLHRCYDRARVWSISYPASCIALAGFASMVLSSYPVIFAGKSFVAPGFGVALLYQTIPALPGMPEEPVWDTKGADVGAVMWAHIPASSIQHRALFHDGELPLWNRYDASGVPLLGQGQSCFGDLLHILPILADGAAWAWDAKFLLAKWLLACGLGLTVWTLTRHLSSALLIALSAPFIGFFVYRVNHPAIFSLCYAPWILYAWTRILRSSNWWELARWCAALIVANGCELNSGTVKEAYMLLIWLNLGGGLMVLFADFPWRQKRNILLATSLAGVIFTLLAAPVWLTFLDSLSRSFTAYDIPHPYQLQPGMLAGLFDEIFYRPFQSDEVVINPSANLCFLLGMLWLVIQGRAIFANRAISALVCTGLVPFAFVYGIIPREWITKMPFVANIMHVDNTFSCVLIILIGVLAGFGWKEAFNKLGTKEGAKDACSVLALLLLVIAVFVGTTHAMVRSGLENHSWAAVTMVAPFIVNYGWSLVLAAAVGIFSLHLIRRRHRLSPATFTLTVLAFVCLHWRHGLHLEGVGFPDYHVTPGLRADFHAKSPGLETLLATRPMPYRIAGIDDNLLPGWSGMYGLEGLGGPDALVNKYYRQLLECCEVERIWDWRYAVHTSTLAQLMRAYDFLNLRYFMDYHGDKALFQKVTREVAADDVNVYESESAWPRAFFTDRMATYNHPLEFAHLVKTEDGRPFAGMPNVEWERIGSPFSLSNDLSSRRIVAAGDYKLTANTTTFTIEAPGAGIAVLSEAYLKDDFRVTVNGARANYFRVNHAFKGVFLERAGTYVISFSYWPRHFTLTLIAAFCGSGLLIASLLLARKFRTYDFILTAPAEPGLVA